MQKITLLLPESPVFNNWQVVINAEKLTCSTCLEIYLLMLPRYQGWALPYKMDFGAKLHWSQIQIGGKKPPHNSSLCQISSWRFLGWIKGKGTLTFFQSFHSSILYSYFTFSNWILGWSCSISRAGGYACAQGSLIMTQRQSKAAVQNLSCL